MTWLELTPDKVRRRIEKADKFSVADLEQIIDIARFYNYPDAKLLSPNYDENNLIRAIATSYVRDRLFETDDKKMIVVLAGDLATQSLEILFSLHEERTWLKRKKFDHPSAALIRQEIERYVGAEYAQGMALANSLEDYAMAFDTDDDNYDQFRDEMYSHIRSGHHHLALMAAHILGEQRAIGDVIDWKEFEAIDSFDEHHHGILEAYVGGFWSVAENLRAFEQGRPNKFRDIKGIWIRSMKQPPPVPFVMHPPMWFMVHEEYYSDVPFVHRMIDENLLFEALQTAEEDWRPEMIPAVRRIAAMGGKVGANAEHSLKHHWPN